MKRSQLGVILSLFAVFGSGIVVGAFGYHSYTTKTVSATAAPRQTRGVAKKVHRRVAHSIHLDSSQLTQLNSILDETRERFKVLKEHQKQETDEVRASHTEKVRAMLRPEQTGIPKIQGERNRRKGTG